MKGDFEESLDSDNDDDELFEELEEDEE